jgi:sulfate adenylyltransferase subunit 1 (EFTu-like GTPase family)
MDNLKSKLTFLIQHLQWKDFETLIDLIFTQAGWQRVGDRGKTQKTLDLELYAPVTSERAIVQIKSQSDVKEFEHYQDEFAKMNDYDKFFYVVHSDKGTLTNYVNETDTKLYLVDKISELTIAAGLVEWVIKKTS